MRTRRQAAAEPEKGLVEEDITIQAALDERAGENVLGKDGASESAQEEFLTEDSDDSEEEGEEVEGVDFGFF